MKKIIYSILGLLLVCAGLAYCVHRLDQPKISTQKKSLIIFNWGDYMMPYMYLSKEKFPLIMALFSSFDYVFEGTSTKLVPVVNAATLLVMIPVFIVFFCCQKQLVEGITAGGVKG